ncbi:hypothetical protein V6N11_044207 [Hibiscus sabdariffa]|uniref:Cellulose synthase n=1 Tax=Hibiscus sabdariffa TaxID=183260 RepID=A0ABR2REI8_9ROSI
MGTAGRLIAGSQNRNEFVLTNADENSRIKSVKELSGEICQICGDEIEITVDGEPFVACNECAFPVCRPCYEYERREGNQACPQCKTRYKRIKGSPGVEGDEEEDDIDDLDNEFDYDTLDPQQVAEAMLSSRLKTGCGSHLNASGMSADSELDSSLPRSHIPLLTYGEEGSEISVDHHALIIPPVVGHGNRVHPMPYTDPSVPCVDGGLEERQHEKFQVVKQEGGNGKNFDGEELDDADLPMMDEGRQPLSRKLPISSSKINPYRMIIILRLAILGLFFHYRILHPVRDAYGLWLTTVICEIWYEKEGKPSELASVDVFVSTVDPMKEPPLITANTVLSILAVDYPVDKVACYVSDDGAAMLTFEALSETTEFARKWVPFCKKFNIEPRAPEWYFSQKIDYLRNKVHPAFVRERRRMKKVPEDGWTMQDGTPWPGNNVRDHPGMIQVFLGHSGVHDVEGNELPRLVYVSREKRPGFEHHKKAGAMNALERKFVMCSFLRFDGIDRHDRYSNRNVVFFDINMKGLDGIQGPIYVGTGCGFRRQALYGFDAPVSKKPPGKTCNCLPKWYCCLCCCSRKKKKKKQKEKTKKSKQREASKQIHALENIEEAIPESNSQASVTSQMKLEKKFGQSPVFVASTFLEDGGVPHDASPASLLREAIQVISCGYEDKTEWGKEVGWIYGSVTEDILTGFKMHCHGWRSVYCIPKRPAFKGSAPINLSDRLHQVLRWALGSVEIFLSKHCPICLVFMALFISLAATGILEMQWGGVGIDDWWRNEQFWVIGGVSSHLFALSGFTKGSGRCQYELHCDL